MCIRDRATFDGLDGGTWHGPRIPTIEDNMEWKKKLGEITNTPVPGGIGPQSEIPRRRFDRAWLDPTRLQTKQGGYCAHALGENPAGLRIAVLRDNVDLPWFTQNKGESTTDAICSLGNHPDGSCVWQEVTTLMIKHLSLSNARSTDFSIRCQ